MDLQQNTQQDISQFSALSSRVIELTIVAVDAILSLLTALVEHDNKVDV